MKQTILFSFVLLLSAAAYSQDTGKDPYAIFGHKSTTRYESKVRDLLFIDNSDTTSPIKAIAFDMSKATVLFLGRNDTIISKAKFNPEQILRWLSVDPMAKERSWLSPYNFVQNNPIIRTDPTGALDDYYENDKGQVQWFNNNAAQISDKSKTTWNNIGTSYVSFTGNSLNLNYQTTDNKGNLQPNTFSVPAVSGRPNDAGEFDYSKTRQAVGSTGPLPEGKYSLDPSKVRELSLKDDIIGQGMAWTQVFGKKVGAFPGGNISWGMARMPIEPNSVNVIDPVSGNTVVRTGFTVHGGTSAGSAGCIDLMRCETLFFDKLKSVSTTPVALRVDYSGITTPIKSPFNSSGTGFTWEAPIN
jgi:hypothetical protein